MGNRPIFAGAPTIEIDLRDWEKQQQTAGRLASVRDYLMHFKRTSGYLPHDAIDVMLVLLGVETINATEEKINGIVEKINETEEFEEVEEVTE